MSRQVLAIIVAVGIFTFVHYFRVMTKEIRLENVPPPPESMERPRQPWSSVTSTPSPRAPNSREPQISAPAPAAWEKFRQKFGEGIAAQFSNDGRLLSARAGAGVGVKAAADFRASDSQKAIARAKEILAAASPIIRMRPELPLENPIYQGDDTSAHVFFHEASGGVPLAPYGTVSVDIGAKGELTGLYSDYVPDLKVTNQAKLSAEEAKARAAAAPKPPGETSEITAGEGRAVMWVLRAATSKGKPEGRHAYEFAVSGRQVVIDAGDGKVLYNRDRRIF